MKRPTWLRRPIVEAVHTRQVREHGGHYGIRDAGLLETALARPINYWLHEPKADIFILAAVLGQGLSRNHCFIDGNKRVAFMAMYVFLGVNGYDLHAGEPEAVDLMLQVAEGNVAETSLAEWLRRHVVPSTTD